MKIRNGLILLSVFVVVFTTEVGASEGKPQSLSGPRIGFSVIGGESAEKLDDVFGAGPAIMQFGWQYEYRFMNTEGFSGLAEVVPMIGGFEQGAFVPSITGLIGLRTSSGAEFGIGPFLGPAGPSLAVVAGYNTQSGGVNFPINIAFVGGPQGVALSLLFGFNAVD